MKVKAGAGEAVTAKASGSVKVGKKNYALKEKSTDVAANAEATITLKPKDSKGTKAIKKHLKKGKKAKATVTVTLTDGAGNTAEEKLTVKLTGKSKKKGGK